jgi:lambda repressor-like predicted transcriptional regulator
VTRSEQTQSLIAELRSRGLSIRAISERTGIGRSTVADYLATLGVKAPRRITGRDGRRYPAVWAPTRPKPARESVRESSISPETALTLLKLDLRNARGLALDVRSLSAEDRARISRDLRAIAKRCGCPIEGR